jgi:hypothetical protein
MFRDLCQPSNHDSAEDFIDFPDDDSLVVETESLGRKNWLALLERV